MSKLKETYSPQDLLLGIAGFIQWSFDNNKEPGWILTNVVHDIFEYLKSGDENWFSPRTSDYKKYLKL